MGDIHPFDPPRQFGQIEDFLETRQTLLRVDLEHLGLHMVFEVATLRQVFEGGQLIAQPGGFFELQGLRGRFHFRLHLVDEVGLLAIEKQLQPLDIAAVVFATDPQIAGGGTLPDAMQQAGAEPAPLLVALFDVERAGAEFEHLLQDIDRPPQLRGAGEGAVQFGPFVGLAGELDAWKVFTRGDLQIGKCLVVFEVGIERRLDVFHQP